MAREAPAESKPVKQEGASHAGILGLGGCAKALPIGFVNSSCRKKAGVAERGETGRQGAEMEERAGPDHKGPMCSMQTLQNFRAYSTA